MPRISHPEAHEASRGGPAAAAMTQAALKHPAALIAAAALLLLLPVLLFGFPNGHDTKFPLLWNLSFSDQFWNGELYPRWLRDVAWGHGGPVFFFYPPIGFYASALAGKLIAVDPLGRYALAVAAAAALALSGGAAYLWLRTMVGRSAAVTGAIVYMAIPYHLAVDLYLRAAYAEFWGFAWMPLILYFIGRSRDWRVAGPVGLAVSYCGLIMSHLPTTLLFSPLAGAYAVMLFRRDKAALATCGFGVGAGIVLSSIYLLPAMLYRDLGVAAQHWTEFQYAFSPTAIMRKIAAPESWRYAAGTPAFVIVLHCSFLYTAYVIRTCWFARSMASPGARRHIDFWLWTCLAIFVLVTPLGTPVWELAPVFKKVQYSWRLHALLCVAILPLWAYAVEALHTFEGGGRRSAAISLFLLVVGMLAIDFAPTANFTRFDPGEARARASQVSGLDELLLPKSAMPLLTSARDLDESLGRHLAHKGPNAWPLEGQADVRVVEWAPRRISLWVNARSPSRLAVRQFFFAGWEARKDGECCLAVSAHPSLAVATVDAPEGDYRLDLVLTKGPIERLGEWLSGAALLLLLAFGGTGWLRRRHHRRT